MLFMASCQTMVLRFLRHLVKFHRFLFFFIYTEYTHIIFEYKFICTHHETVEKCLSGLEFPRFPKASYK